MRVSFLALILFLCCVYMVSADNNGPEKTDYLHLSTGYVFGRTRDMAMSPLQFSGSGIGGGIEYFRQREKTINIPSVTYDFATLKSGGYPALTGAVVYMDKIQLQHMYLRRHMKIVNSDMRFGTALSTGGTLRNHTGYYNNNFNYDFITSLSAAGLWKKKFTFFRRNFSADFTSVIPLFSVLERPSFASSAPLPFLKNEKHYFRSFVQALQPATLNHFQRMTNTFGLDYPIKSGNMLRLEYKWDFYHFSLGNSIVQATHNINFKLVIAL